MRSSAEKRIGLRSVTTGHGSAGGPCVERGGAMTDGHQTVPNLFVAAVLIAAGERRLDRERSARSWLDGGRSAWLGARGIKKFRSGRSGFRFQLGSGAFRQLRGVRD